jgi:hypothetical protein
LKSKEDKVQIKQFKDGSSHFWVNDSHYHLNASEELVWCAGGQETNELREAIQSYIKRNKKKFIPRSPNIFEREEIVYTEVLGFGKYVGKKVNEVDDVPYLKWCLKNVDFAGKEKLKEEITAILK